MRSRIHILEDIHPDGISAMESYADISSSVGTSWKDHADALREATGVVVRSATRVDKSFLDATPALRVVARAGTGLDNIDVETLSIRQIQLVSAPTGNITSVAEYTIAQIICLSRHLFAAHDQVRIGDFRRSRVVGREIESLTVGIIGLGNVGLKVATLLNAFGCKLIAYDPRAQNRVKFRRLGGMMTSDLETLLGQSDVISLHANATAENANLLDTDRLRQVKNGAILINTARGSLVSEDGLLEALNSGRIAAAAVDVLLNEPPLDRPPGDVAYDHPFLSHPKIIVTPHMAASTADAQRRISLELAEKLGEILSRP